MAKAMILVMCHNGVHTPKTVVIATALGKFRNQGQRSLLDFRHDPQQQKAERSPQRFAKLDWAGRQKVDIEAPSMEVVFNRISISDPGRRALKTVLLVVFKETGPQFSASLWG